jgi:hypothetical protein
MIKKPDLSELTKKFDLNSIVGGIKSLLNQAADVPIPQVDPSDAIGTKLAQLSLMTQQMAKTHEQLAKDLVAASQLFNELYKDLEALRRPPEIKTEHPTAVEPEIRPEDEK